CPTCSFTGMKGRVAIYETMPISEELRDGILRSATAAELQEIAKSQGMKTLRQSGLLKVLDGTTTIEGVLRVTLAQPAGTRDEGRNHHRDHGRAAADPG